MVFSSGLKSFLDFGLMSSLLISPAWDAPATSISSYLTQEPLACQCGLIHHPYVRVHSIDLVPE